MDIVNELSLAGFALFALNGKVPAEGKSWVETKVDKNLSRFDFANNYAVIAGDNLVIDVDVKNGQQGKESFARLTEDLKLGSGWEANTFVVKTGSGGFHVYLRIGQRLEIHKHLKFYPGLEFLHGNMYCVGPECIHPDTKKVYQIIFGSPSSIMQAPTPLLEAIAKKQVALVGATPEKGFTDDDPLNIERFKELLSSMPEVAQGNRSNSAYIASCRGRDLGLSKEVCLTVLRENYNGIKVIPAIEDVELIECANHAYKYAKGKMGSLNVGALFKTAEVGEPIDFGAITYDLDSKGFAKKSFNNCVNYLITLPQVKDSFRFNIFSGSIEINSNAPWFKERGDKGPNLCDEDIILLKYFLAKTIKVEFPQQTVLDSVIVVAHKRHYHPIRNYLNSLEWDGKKRLDTWLIDYGHAIDTMYTRQIGRKVLCAAVRRVFEPGCKWDHVLIIEGSQGIGKSTACRILGRNWAGDINLDPHAKDSIHMMLGKWVIELSEMTALRWSDANALKSFLTREKDTVRLSYERHAKDYPRQSVFIGTVNPEHVGYLNDITGNRRYWITKFNGMVDLLNLENDCNQLWAEAKAGYQEEAPYLTGVAADMQVLETQKRMPEDPMRNNVMRWVKENPTILETGTESILEYLGVPSKNITRGDQSRIAQALVEMGWEKKIERVNGIFTTRYIKPLRDRMNLMQQEI